uniref:hypothetical protein n=1 Tax=Pseudomonas aeruginosa TaxID=287 RepID=UPI001F1AA977|nr:hypothetical protein [Pseudomonas aeruginosa]
MNLTMCFTLITTAGQVGRTAVGTGFKCRVDVTISGPGYFQRQHILPLEHQCEAVS